MAGLFSLGSTLSAGGRGNTQQESQPENEIPQETWFWYNKAAASNNNEVSLPYSKATLELWQQQQQQQQHQQQQAAEYLYQRHHQELYASAAGLAVGPAGRATPSINSADDLATSRSAFMMMRSSGSGGGMSCQDCGNQAKKDCIHLRCRTCCKSRGFDCQTHVKSTWVPAAKRRERQQQLASLQQQQIQGRGGSADSTKRPRDNSSSPSLACTRLIPSGLEMENFPSQVSTTAMFRCVRVSGYDDNEDQLAYQTAVTIGGHVFKGLLYDQGPESSSNYVVNQTGDTTTNSSGDACGGGNNSTGAGGLHPLELITSAPASAVISPARGTGGGVTVASSGGPFMDPSTLFTAPLSTFISSGTQFFPSTRS